LKHWFKVGRNYSVCDLLLDRTTIIVITLPDQIEFYIFSHNKKSFSNFAEVAELVDALDSKSSGAYTSCRIYNSK
jgi:hypothetical protein